jgi:hypothetical protein
MASTRQIWIVHYVPQRGGDVTIEFLSMVAVIAPDPAASRELYVGALGLPLEGQGNGYYHSEQIAGCSHSASGRYPRRLASAHHGGQRSALCSGQHRIRC